jgi:hypothetical protein
MNQVKGEEGKETCLGCAKVLWHLWKQKILTIFSIGDILGRFKEGHTYFD